MNNNKGFTLVELLAVMVILISISLVAVGSITESLKRTDEKECKRNVELAIGAAKIYFSLNETTPPTTVVSIYDLKRYGYLDENIALDSDYKIRLFNNEYRCGYTGHDTIEECCQN